MAETGKSVMVIGGGIVGLCSALFAAQRGFEVTVLDRSGPSELGCSFGNAGLIVPSHIIPLAAPGMIAKGLRWMLNPESPFYLRPRLSWDLLRWTILFWRHANEAHTRNSMGLLASLNLESRQLFEDLSREFGFGLEKRGLLMLCKTQKSLDEEAEVARLASALGMTAEVCAPARLRELDPSVEMHALGGVWFQQDCHLDPERLMHALRIHLASLKVEIRHSCEVVDFSLGDQEVRQVILADGNSIGADHFVLACGSWSPRLARQAGLRLPMQTGKGYSLTLESPVQLPQVSSILTEAKVAVTPMGSSLRFAGTMEVGAQDLSINERRVRGITGSIQSYFPHFNQSDFDAAQPWAGLRPCSPDGLPYVGRAPRYPNLTIATGHAMLGLSLGPVTGRMVADLLTNENEPDTRLRPDRF